MPQRDNETDEAFVARMAKEAAEHIAFMEVHAKMTAEHDAWMAENMLRPFLPLIDYLDMFVQYLNRRMKMPCGFYT